MPDIEDMPSPLERLVSDLNHTGKQQYVGMLFPIPARLQANIYGLLEALTHHAGISRNKMVNQLLEVGLMTTLDALPEELRHQLESRSGDVIRTAFEKNGGVWERGEA